MLDAMASARARAWASSETAPAAPSAYGFSGFSGRV
jgi:hypothetical protein